MNPLIELQGVDFSYGQQPVLRRIDLPVEAGTTLGIIGPNGGGKTTLLRLLLGLEQPSRGTIGIAGLSPRQATRRGDLIGYLPQRAQSRLGFPLDVRQLVRLGLVGKTGMLRPFTGEDLAFVDQLIERVGLRDLARQPVYELSGGQLQRALIARALAPRPRILLLDEPTTGIDPLGQQQFIELLQALKDDLKLTIVLVSHDLRAVTAIADRIACLNTTLHYHDVPEHLPPELMYRMFACDLEAIGLGGEKLVQLGAPVHVCDHEP